MAAICYECGDTGHIAPNCPNKAWTVSDSSGDGRPAWCGMCDQRSRHVDLPDGRVKRCQCHPESHLQLKRHRKCPICHRTIVEWDSANDCDLHILAGAQRPYVGAGPDQPKASLQSEAARQVAEARAAREEAERGETPGQVDFAGGLPTPREYPSLFPVRLEIRHHVI